MDTYPVLSLSGKSFFFIFREEGRGGETKEGRRGKKKARERGQEREGSLERAEEKRQKKEKMEGDIDCSQAEGALCGAWWWALRTPGLSLLSGPEEEQTHISLRVGDLCKCACNCMSCFPTPSNRRTHSPFCYSPHPSRHKK